MGFYLYIVSESGTTNNFKWNIDRAPNCKENKIGKTNLNKKEELAGTKLVGQTYCGSISYRE